jgi:fatty acid desaturase
LAEQTQLSFLRDRLKKIRKNKRNTTIRVLAVSIMVVIIQQLYWKNFIFGFLVWLSIGIVSALAIIRYYNSQEAQVRWQIAQLTRSDSKNG